MLFLEWCGTNLVEQDSSWLFAYGCWARRRAACYACSNWCARKKVLRVWVHDNPVRGWDRSVTQSQPGVLRHSRWCMRACYGYLLVRGKGYANEGLMTPLPNRSQSIGRGSCIRTSALHISLLTSRLLFFFFFFDPSIRPIRRPSDPVLGGANRPRGPP